MMLTNIKISKLFYSEDINLNLIQEKQISIIHSLNGTGKTTVLNLIIAVLNCDRKKLLSIPFESITLSFIDNYMVTVKKEVIPDKNNTTKKQDIIYIKNGNEIVNFVTPYKHLPKEIRNSTMHNSIGSFEILDSELDEHGKVTFDRDEIRPGFGEARRALIDLHREFQRKFNILMIKTDRLFINSKDFDINLGRYFSDYSSRKSFIENTFSEKNEIETVKAYSIDLQNRINSAKRRKEKKSDELDSTFPLRLIEKCISPDIPTKSKDQLLTTINDLNEKRREYQLLGLLDESNNETDIPVSLLEKNELTTDLQKVLELYIEDSKEKLKYFDSVQDQIKLFRKIINDINGFSNKLLKITSDGMKFISSKKDESEIEIEHLSSGEKNIIILYYYLIFICNKHSIILIDEPEISMHISWQEEFVNVLTEICKKKDIQAIIATHSPNILNGHFDLAISLIGDKDER